MNTHDVLTDLVAKARCKPGWLFSLRIDTETDGLCFVVSVTGYDSATPSKRNLITVSHWFPVPLATYNERAWRRWMFECCRGVENHELGEWFRIGADRPFLPLHGPGELPYVVHEFRPETDTRITQDGSIREPYPDF